MEERKVLVVRPEDKRHTIYGAGDEYMYFATGKETDGHYFFLEGIVPPGGGPPPHIQTREEEAFYILEGTVTFYAQGESVQAGPGTYLNIPKGVKHKFRNNTEETARMLIFFAPAGVEGLFDEMASNTDIAQHPEKALDIMNEVGSRYGLAFYGN